jgi:hypothetical protein
MIYYIYLCFSIKINTIERCHNKNNRNKRTWLSQERKFKPTPMALMIKSVKDIQVGSTEADMILQVLHLLFRLKCRS